MTSAWKAFPLLFTMGIVVWGCIPEAHETTVYMACRGEGGACADGSQCLVLVCCHGAQCAEECVEDNDCPALDGYEPVCQIFTSGRYCAIRCAGEDAPCPESLSCSPVEKRDGTSGFLCL